MNGTARVPQVTAAPRIPQLGMWTLPPWVNGPWISLQAPPNFSLFSGTYVPIYMLKRLYETADPSKGGSFVFAFVKGPVPEEREDVPAPRGSSVSYTKEFFGGGYPPRIKPPALPRLGALAPRNILREPVLIVTFSISAVKSVKVDLGMGLAISAGGPQRPAPAIPLAVFTVDSFSMDAEAWYRAASGVQQKLPKVGQVTLTQDMAEMRDLREALTLKVLRGPNSDFSGGYVAVQYLKEVSRLPGGGARISVVLLNRERGGPAAENMVPLGSERGVPVASTPQGELKLYDPRFFRVRDTRFFVPIPRAIKAGSPIVVLSLSIDSRGLIQNVTIALSRVNTDMTLSNPLAVLNLNGASWEAAARSTNNTSGAGHGAGVVVSNNGMQFEVGASRAMIIR